MSGIWDALVDCICRPPRDSYQESEVLGKTSKKFKHGDVEGVREDLVITNKRGQKIQCSHFLPVDRALARDGKLPCVVYCHCNSGSKRDGEEAVFLLLPLGVTVFTFDFTGSGLSDGEWVTLGANEVDDLEAVINHLRQSDTCSTLGLWGRSMGAVTALMYSKRDPSIAGMVLDSPFSCLTQLMLEVVEEQKLPIPKAVTKLVLGAMRKSVRKRAGFDINDVTPLDVVKESFIPALFGHGEQDTFIKIHHSEKLYEAYSGDKNMLRFEGDHNSRRPEFFYSSINCFFFNTLRLGDLEGSAETHDLAAVRQQSSQSYQLQGRRSGGRLPSQTMASWPAQLDLQAARLDVAAMEGGVIDAEELMLQQALRLSLRDAGVSSPAAGPARNAAAVPSAPPAPPAAAAEDDFDEELRAAIALSLREAEPASLSAAPAGLQTNALQQTTPAPKTTASGNVRDQSKVDAA